MRRIAVFARWPELGKVKTRLAPALTAGPTLRLYRGMLLDALAAGAAAPGDERSVWWASPPPAWLDTELRASLAAGHWQVHVQLGDDLGARLTNAFAQLSVHAGDRAVVIGADCPELDAATIAQAFAELDHSDVVLGPAGDGGFYLIAATTAIPALFHEIAWSSDRVLAQTIERAEGEGKRIVLLRTMEDLDTPGDLTRCLGRELSRRNWPTTRGGATGSASLGPHTQCALGELGLLPERAG